MDLAQEDFPQFIHSVKKMPSEDYYTLPEFPQAAFDVVSNNDKSLELEVEHSACDLSAHDATSSLREFA